jgi:C4-dicarboxylate transporter, DctQ subunit
MIDAPDSNPQTKSWLTRLEEGFLVLLVSIMLVLAGGQILLRNVFSVTWLWTDPLIRHLVLWIGFLGAMLATRQDRHIHIDALLRIVPPPFPHLLRLLSLVFSAAVCALLAWIGLRFVLDERQYGMAAFLDIPSWYVQTVFPLAFSVMAWRFFRRAYQLLRQGDSSPASAAADTLHA